VACFASRFNPKQGGAIAETLYDGDDSGEAALQDLAPEQVETILKQVDLDGDGFPDVIAEMNPLTKMFWASTSKPPSAVEIDHISHPKVLAASHEEPMELKGLGIFLPHAKHDEQQLPPSAPDMWRMMAGAAVRDRHRFATLMPRPALRIRRTLPV